MAKPSEELKKEVLDYIYTQKGIDHRKCKAVWDENPWLAVSMYELAMYPAMLELPLATPSGFFNEEDQLDHDIKAFMSGKPVYCEKPRGKEGEYDMGDGVIAKVNRFGRLENPEDVFGEEE